MLPTELDSAPYISLIRGIFLGCLKAEVLQLVQLLRDQKFVAEWVRVTYEFIIRPSLIRWVIRTNLRRQSRTYLGEKADEMLVYVSKFTR